MPTNADTEIVFAVLTLELDLTWPIEAPTCAVIRATFIYCASVHESVRAMNAKKVA